MIEIATVSGYSGFGRNMTAIKIGEKVVVIDIGLHMENYIKLSEEAEDVEASVTTKDLIKEKAIPNPKLIEEWKDKVVAIVPGHAHLDHLGAIPYLADQFPNATIYGTPFTIEVLRAIVKDNELRLDNTIKKIEVDGRQKIDNDITIELVNITHSTPQTSVVVIHTPKGKIVYASDFKMDNTPTLGKKPNYKRLTELGNEGKVIALICESTNAAVAGKTPSEAVAKEMLRDVITTADTKRNAIIVTTFASHLARLKSVFDFANKMNRKVVFMGRSMKRYIDAGEKAGVIKFSDKAEIVNYSSKIKRKFKQISQEGKHKYIIVATGHQGEPKSTLSKVASGELGFNFTKDDCVVFSCKVIPTQTNKANRERLEKELRRMSIRIYKDVHQSGHAAREDIRDFVQMVKPKQILPMHGDEHMRQELQDLVLETGISSDKVHLMHDGDRIKL